MNKVYKIYKINFPNGKCYIGQTYNLQRRWREHLYEASITRSDLKIYRAMRKYHTTIEDFNLIEDNILTVEEANAKEMYYINKFDSYKNGYNSTLGGDSGFQPHGENHPFAILTDEEILNIRQFRASKQYTFNQVYKMFQDRITYSGFSKIWEYISRPEIGAEYNTPELDAFYKTDKRMMKGERHFLSKLSSEQVIDIRNRYFVLGDKMITIWEEYKELYSLSGFRKIVLGYTYTDIPIPQQTSLCKKKKEWLSKEQVQFIRQKYQEGYKVMEIINNWFPNRSESTISLIVHNKRYINY